jgi:hypothetical protein
MPAISQIPTAIHDRAIMLKLRTRTVSNLSFDRDEFGKITRLIHVSTSEQSYVIGN